MKETEVFVVHIIFETNKEAVEFWKTLPKDDRNLSTGNMIHANINRACLERILDDWRIGEWMKRKKRELKEDEDRLPEILRLKEVVKLRNTVKKVIKESYSSEGSHMTPLTALGIALEAIKAFIFEEIQKDYYKGYRKS